jgi:hypothetical protein
VFFSYAINTSLTGQLNTYNRAPGSTGRFRNSWTGGSGTSINDVASAMMTMEMVNFDINFIPAFSDGSSGTETQTIYPPAIRELWAPVFKKVTGTCVVGTETDPLKVPFNNNIIMGFVDGHSKAISADKFLSNTPTAAQYVVSSRWSCQPNGGTWTVGATPSYTGSWPMWGL